jgi:hypothetical protein
MKSCWTCFCFILKQCVQEFSFTFAYFQSSDWFFALYLPSNPYHEIKSMKFLGRRIFSLWSGFLLVFFNKLVQLISLHHSLVPLLVLSCIDMRLPSFVKSKMHFLSCTEAITINQSWSFLKQNKLIVLIVSGNTWFSKVKDSIAERNCIDVINWNQWEYSFKKSLYFFHNLKKEK